MHDRHVARALLLSLSLGVAVGCTTLQSPKVLEKGEQTLTLAAAVTWSEVEILFPAFEPAFRTHIADGLDLGVQVSVPPFHVIVDTKYQLVQRPPYYLAGGLGAGFGITDIAEGEVYWAFVARGLLIGGTERFYAGLRPLFYFVAPPLRADRFSPDIVLGLSVGAKVRFVAEATVSPVAVTYDWSSETFTAIVPLASITIGAGVMFTF